tara:strand:- start:1171 stop:1743 length:573 start_codon:yes stop_codon:yes gene_type:complete
MIRTIIYFHGFASSSDSDKAKTFQKYISSFKSDINLIIPNLSNSFKDAAEQINEIIESNQKPVSFMGSSLGGYYAAYFSSKYNSKAILINPAIPPLEGFDIYLGENENYSTGERFVLDKDDMRFIRSLSYKEYNNQENTLLLLESGDEVLNYVKTLSYFKGSYINVEFGGSHSYESFSKKLGKIRSFLEI